jgi:hypothetical protein
MLYGWNKGKEEREKWMEIITKLFFAEFQRAFSANKVIQKIEKERNRGKQKGIK